jgi:hypothetical protein
MFVSITEEIIDAIIQNEGRRVGQPRKPFPVARAPRNLADLKPEWGQVPPEALGSMPVFPRGRA